MEPAPRSSDGWLDLEVPAAFAPLWVPAPYKAYFGGRGSAKSWSFARALVSQAQDRTLRVGCFREVQASIRESVKQLLDDTILASGFVTEDGRPFFRSTDTEIVGENDSLFMFKGLRVDPQKVKSTEGLDIAWVAEANACSRASLEILDPTLRGESSEMWFDWNPGRPDDPVDQMFRNPDGSIRTAEQGLMPGSIVRRVSWRDNPFFTRLMRQKMERDYRRDPERAAHVWGGEYQAHSEAQVFRHGRNWRTEAFETPTSVQRLYFGMDFGFTDPACLVRSWMYDAKTLMVDYEAYALGCELDHLPALFAGDCPPNHSAGVRWANPRRYPGVPGALRWPIRADSSRPDVISYLRRHGFRVQGATKGAGSVEEGVEFLRSVDIVVHPRCQHLIGELTSYSYKVDKRTEEVLPVLEDRDNHLIDSLRYSLEGTRRGQSARLEVGGFY